MEPKSPQSPVLPPFHLIGKELLDERVYKSINEVHPGMKIDRDAVDHIRLLVERLLHEMLIVKPTTVTELDKQCGALFAPQQSAWISKETAEAILKWSGSRSHRGFNARTVQLHSKLVAMIKDYLGIKEKEKKEREKELERMGIYLLTMIDFITEDVIKWTGHYVKKLREADSISLQNVKISLSADTSLMQLNELLHKGEDDGACSSSGQSMVFDFDLIEPLSPRNTVVGTNGTVNNRVANYAEVSSQLLSDERQYLRELNLVVNVFRRKFEAVLSNDDKGSVEEIFGNIPELQELSMKMERRLEDAREMSDEHCVGSGVWELAEGHEFDVYQQYTQHLCSTDVGSVISKVISDKRYTQLFDTEARSFVGSSSSPQSSSFSLAVKYVLPSLLLAPLIHFFKYIEYCTRLHSFSQSEEDRIDLSNIRSYLSGVGTRMEKAWAMNASLQRKLKLEQSARSSSDAFPSTFVDRILEIERKLDGYMGEPIARTCRELLKEGDLTMVRPSITVITGDVLRRRWLTERHVYVFDHLVILCKAHKNGWKFKDRLAIRAVQLHDLEDTEVMQHAFRIDGRERSGTRGSDTYRNFSYTFVCKSAEEKEAWMTSLVNIQSRSLLDRMLDAYLKEERKRIPLVMPASEQYIFAEPDSDENIVFEDYTSSSGIPVVKHGSLVKLVERLTYHLYTDNAYVRTFLISYRSFCTPTRLLQLLIQRFEVPVPKALQQPNANDMRGGPLAGRYDTVQSHGLSNSNLFNTVFLEQSFQRFRKEYEAPIQLKVLNVVRKWVSDHWYDFESDHELEEALHDFLARLTEGSRISGQHKKFAKNILSVMKKKKQQAAGQTVSEGHFNFAFDGCGEDDTPDMDVRARLTNSFQPHKPQPLWHTAKKGDQSTYDLLTLHPLEIGRQLTLIHCDLYRAIKPIELVGAAWMKADKYKRSPQLLKLTDHSTQLTYWVSRSIVETESLEERVAMFARVLEVMSVFEELHNFTGLVAFYSALNKACVHRLTWCWDRLDNEKQKCYDRFKKLCNPHWTEMVKRLQSINPPCVPFFGHYLTSIVFFEGGNSTFVNMPGNDMKHEQLVDESSSVHNQKRLLVSFLKCRRIASVISEIQMYQNEPYALQVEPSIRYFQLCIVKCLLRA